MRIRPVVFIATAIIGCALIVAWFVMSDSSKQADVRAKEIAHLTSVGFTNVGIDKSAGNGSYGTNAYSVNIGKCRFAVAANHGNVTTYEFLQVTPYLSAAGVVYVNKLINSTPQIKALEPVALEAYGLPSSCY